MTAKAGVACSGQDSTGASFADIDGDSDLDLLVNALGNGTRIFQNDGRGSFEEVTQRAGVASKMGSTSLALADIEGDGDLDLYVANFRPTTVMDRPGTKFTVNVVGGKTVVTAVDGVPTSSPEFAGQFTVNEAGTVLESGEVDALYLNNGRGVFTSVSFTNGAFLDESGQVLHDPPRDWGARSPVPRFHRRWSAGHLCVQRPFYARPRVGERWPGQIPRAADARAAQRFNVFHGCRFR